MKLLVVGSLGQVGAELIRIGNNTDIDMIGVDIQDVDIADAHALGQLIQPLNLDLIINAAAFTAVDAAENQPEEAYAANRDGPAHLADVCSQNKIPLIHISTDYVFDGTKEGAYVESDTVSPTGVYAKSKVEGENEVTARLTAHLILRTAWLYSWNGHNFVKTMLRLFRKNQTVNVVDDQFGCPTYATDLAHAIIRIATQITDQKRVPWGIYHFTGMGKTSWYEFALKIFKMAEKYEKFRVSEIKPIPSSAYPTPVKRPANSVLDCSKIEKNFDIQRRPWEESLAEMINKVYERYKV